MTTTEYNPFEVAQSQFDHVANQLQLAGEVRQILRWPLREFRFQISVHMDDGTNRVFFGFRVQHNDARGPCKGGAVLDPSTLSVGEKERLCRGWVAGIWKNLGPRNDVPAPDVGSTPQM